MTITATSGAAAEAAQSAPTVAPAEHPARAPRAVRPVRRTFSAEYKRRIVAEYDQAPAGQKGRVVEFWALGRLSNCLEDNTGIHAALAADDFSVAAAGGRRADLGIPAGHAVADPHHPVP